jgi:spore coat assembly protein SafA
MLLYKEENSMSGSNIPPPEACTGFIYTVQRGDTLFLIAQRFGISLDSIIAANPQIANPNNIFPGQQICVPAIIPTIECCMLLFRTANVPVLPEAEAGGVARIFQTPEGGVI